MTANLEALKRLASEKSGSKQRSRRSVVEENLDLISAARSNGWPLDRIAEALGIEGKNPAGILSAHLYLINKKRRPAAKAAPPAPAQAPSQPAVGLPRPRLDVSQLPPPPGSRTAPETEWERLKRETDAEIKAKIAALNAESNQPKDVK